MPDSDSQTEGSDAETFERPLDEHERLESERTARRHTKHASFQSLSVRWASIGASVIVMILMAAVLVYHMLCQPMPDSGYAWVMVAAPIASLTAIVVTLLLAGFPRANGKNLSRAARDGASFAAEITGGGTQ